MPADKRATRLGVLAVVATLLFGAMGARLWFLQTVQAESLQQTVDARKTKTVRLVPERGRILDAKGRIIADNQRVLTVAVEWDVIRRDTDRAQLFTRLSGWLDMPVAAMEARYDAKRYSRYKPLPLEEGVAPNVAVAIQERSEDFPGVSIVQGWKRTYPYAPLASHLIGYMGAITADDEQHYKDLGYDTSVDGEEVGRAGVELSMENALHGKWGKVVYEVDANNRIVRQLSYEAPVNGEDVQLSIDLDLQQYAERLLQTQLALKRLFTAANPEITKPDGTKGPLDEQLAVGTQVHYPAPAGSTVVLDNQTGSVLAMASYPTFDNRWFSADVPKTKFDQIFPTTNADGSKLDPDKSALTNRAIQGQYNLGSTFKVFTAYAALSTGRLTPNTIYDDQGTYTLSADSVDEQKCATGTVRCVYRNSSCPPDNTPCRYGRVNVTNALAVSSDSFFYHLGEEFWLTPGTQLQDQVRQFGFGSKTGVDLPFEFAGRVPTNELKQQLVEKGVLAKGESKRLQPGDVLLLAIGQGLLAATPLQLAVGYSTFANGGNVVTPRVVQAILAPETPDSDTPGLADMSQAVVVQQIAPVSRAIPMPPEVHDPIQAGIRQNITGPGANGHSTTAEELFADYPRDAIPVAGKTGTAQGFKSYPWFDSSAFTAYSIDPTHPFTVTSYLEKSGYGSVGAAPVVKCMFEALSGLIPLDPVQVSEALDTSMKVPAKDLSHVDVSCMRSTNANTITPGPASGAKD
jgi:penicillin-binding protein 2